MAANQHVFRYFDLKFTSTYNLLGLFWPNFTSTKTLRRPKLYFDQNFTSTKTVLRPVLPPTNNKSRFDKMSK